MPDFPNLHPEEGGAKINNIYTDISPTALGQLVDYITQSGIPIPVTQIVGFTQFVSNRAVVTTAESTTSGSYTDLATAGPTITNLSDGKYLVIVTAVSTGGNTGYISPSVNGSTPSDADGANVGGGGSMIGVSTQTLSSGNNTVKIQYKTNGLTMTFSNRNLVVLKYANK